MPGVEELSNEVLIPIFEVGRWAPSSFNIQRWYRI
jgi:hypothetical protein